ncbi:MAG: hypothetical protein P4L69_05560 [Desulfosporosinus sp.]|nr:hypothetical protein [Desulfosporosinus sp.]
MDKPEDNQIKTAVKSKKDMDDAPIRIILLRDADNCASNEALRGARSKSTIKELEKEYEDWFNYLGKP